MPTIQLTTVIRAPVHRTFDLSRSIDLHVRTAGKSREQAVAGVTSGLIGPGQEVTWRARHFGVWQTLTVRISQFDRPHLFADTMVRGAFHTMEHFHRFESRGGETVMHDEFSFRSPLGFLGSIVDRFILSRYMRNFLEERNRILKNVAETEDWKHYLEPNMIPD